MLVADRTGKGLRTAPRDAMIALSVDERDLGQAFGVHRMLDSTGAFLGPLAAIGLLALAGTTSYDSVFVGSLCAALIGLLILVLFVRNRPGPIDAPPVRIGGVRQLLGLSAFRRLCVVAALLGLATVGDGFIFLVLQDRDDLPVLAFPLLAVGTSLAFLILAVPLGRLADRVGRWPVIVGGYGCLFVVYLLLGFGHAPLAVIVLLYGAFYAATDGVLAALVVPAIPDHLKTTGLALMQTGQALAYLVSSVAFGLLWSSVGVGVACLDCGRGGRGAAAVLRLAVAPGPEAGRGMRGKIIATVVAAALLITVAVVFAVTRRTAEVAVDPTVSLRPPGLLVRDTDDRSPGPGQGRRHPGPEPGPVRAGVRGRQPGRVPLPGPGRPGDPRASRAG